jgi:hypothetical protein
MAIGLAGKIVDRVVEIGDFHSHHLDVYWQTLTGKTDVSTAQYTLRPPGWEDLLWQLRQWPAMGSTASFVSLAGIRM